MPASSVAGSDFSFSRTILTIPKIEPNSWVTDPAKFIENTTTVPFQWRKMLLHKVYQDPKILAKLLTGSLDDFSKYFSGKDYLAHRVYEIKDENLRIRLLQDDQGTLVFLSCTFNDKHVPKLESAYIIFSMKWGSNDMPLSVLNLFDPKKVKEYDSKVYETFFRSDGSIRSAFEGKNFLTDYDDWKKKDDARRSEKFPSVSSSPIVQTPGADVSAFDPFRSVNPISPVVETPKGKAPAVSSTTVKRPEVSRGTKPSTTNKPLPSVKGKEKEKDQSVDTSGYETERPSESSLQKARDAEARRVAKEREETDKAKEILEKAAQRADAEKAEADRLKKIESDKKAAEELAEQQRLETERREREERQRIKDEAAENERKRLELEEQQKFLQRQAEEAQRRREAEKQAKNLAKEAREREELEKKEREEAEALAEAQRISDAHASEQMSMEEQQRAAQLRELRQQYADNEKKLASLRERFRQQGLSAEEEVPQLIDKGKGVDYSRVATSSNVTVEQFPEDEDASLQADLQVLDSEELEGEEKLFYFTQDGRKVMHSELSSLPREDLIWISEKLRREEADLLKRNEDLKKNNSKLRKSIFEFGSFNPLGWFTSNYEGVRSLSSEEESSNYFRLPPIPPIGTVFTFGFWFFVVFFVFRLLNMIKSFFGLGEKGGRRR